MEGTVKLIDANAEELQSRINRFFKKGTQRFIIRTILKDAPAVDAVPVVRCENCAVPHNKWTGCPNLNGLVPPQDFFCAYGEPKEGK